MNPCRFTAFSTCGVHGVKDIKYVYSGFVCYNCGLVSLSSRHFIISNLWIGPVFILSLVVNF
jgi:hypothetical protein